MDFKPNLQLYRPYIRELRQLFDDMDAAYDRVADIYRFHCTGCADSCCRSRFYHHTLLEYLYLAVGLMELPSDQRDDISGRAKGMKRRGPADRPMCPVNFEGRCRLYRFRPMICRLHGVAYRFVRPDHTDHSGPGCDEFTLLAGNFIEEPLDRTPIYRRMALLEKKIREQISFKMRIRMTVAEMVVRAASGLRDL